MGVVPTAMVSHGHAWSMYFLAPEANKAGFSPVDEWARRLDHTLHSALARPHAHEDLP